MSFSWSELVSQYGAKSQMSNLGVPTLSADITRVFRRFLAIRLQLYRNLVRLLARTMQFLVNLSLREINKVVMALVFRKSRLKDS